MNPAKQAAQEALAPRAEDPLLKSAAHSGELTVARARVWLTLPLLAMQFLPGWSAGPLWRVGITTTGFAALWSVAMWWVVRRRYSPVLGFVSSAGDVSLVTATLVGYIYAGFPELAATSRVAFEVYLLALAAASFRYDWRAPALAGGFAVVQYTWVCFFAASRVELGSGRFPWNVVVARLVLLLAMICISVALVQKARLLREASIHDRLTGLLNRAAFEDRLREEASRALRFGRIFAVAVLDVDLFKRINDTHGHAAGDAVLQQIAAALRRGNRTPDIVARWGGEEFAFLLPETRAEGAVLHMERVRAAVAMEDLVAGSARQAVRLTVSVGVATFPDDGQDVGEALARADARLYEAKRLGRNRVVGPRPTGQGEPARTVDPPPPARA
jgi:diguanylate cyclase (GGDEF)-like protein